MTKEFKKLVEKEALKLHKHTTAEEKELLTLALKNGSIYPNEPHDCIYGSMTGNCFNARATELMNKCTKKFVRSIDSDEDIEISDHKERINDVTWSPIESYICQKDANIKAVIKMIIKGKSKLHKL